MGIVTSFKRLVKSAICAAGSDRGEGAVILRYHSIKEDPDSYADTIGRAIIHSKSEFEAHMECLAKHYHQVTLEDVSRHLREGVALPPNAVAVTFDDGYADNYEIAAPIMKRYGIRAAIYVTTSCIGDAQLPWFIRLRHAFANAHAPVWKNEADNTVMELSSAAMRWEAFLAACAGCAVICGDEQRELVRRIENALEVDAYLPAERLFLDIPMIRALVEAGHTVGPHTITHPNLAKVMAEDMRNEIDGGLKALEAATGLTHPHFSYPSPYLQPHYNDMTVETTRRCGFHTAVTCTHGCVMPGDDPLRLKRIWVPSHPAELRWEIRRARRAGQGEGAGR